MSNISYINNQILNETIYLSYNEINIKDINQILRNKLIEKKEGKCYNNGYIIRGSINIINKTLGKLVNLDSENKLLYNIKYSANILNPSKDEIIDCYIDNINKMGIIAYIKFKDIISGNKDNNTLQESPLIIIIPYQTVENIDEMNIGKKIKVKINAIRIKFNTDKIQIVGEIIN